MKNIFAKSISLYLLAWSVLMTTCLPNAAFDSTPGDIICAENIETQGIVGNLDSDTLTLTLTGQKLHNLKPLPPSSGLNIFSLFLDIISDNDDVAKIDSFTFNAAGTKVISKTIKYLNDGEYINDNNENQPFTRLEIKWGGIITSNDAVLSIKLKPGTKDDTATFELRSISSAVEFIKISDFDNIDFDPSTVTNTLEIPSVGSVVFSDVGNFTLIGPSQVVSPGKAAIAFQFDNIPSNFVTATLNGAKVEFAGNNIIKDGMAVTEQTTIVGVAILDIPTDSSQLDLVLDIRTLPEQNTSNPIMIMTSFPFGNTNTVSNTVELGSISIEEASTGSIPTISSAGIINRSKNSTIEITGTNFSNNDNISINILPTDHPPNLVATKNEKFVRAILTSGDCIPNGSYVVVTTSGGSTTKKFKIKGKCTKPIATLECRK